MHIKPREDVVKAGVDLLQAMDNIRYASERMVVMASSMRAVWLFASHTDGEHAIDSYREQMEKTVREMVETHAQMAQAFADLNAARAQPVVTNASAEAA